MTQTIPEHKGFSTEWTEYDQKSPCPSPLFPGDCSFCDLECLARTQAKRGIFELIPVKCVGGKAGHLDTS